jgi:hypothetical protein
MLKDEDERLMNYLLRIDESSARHQHATGESFNTGRTPASRHAGNDGNGHECRNPALWSEIAKVIAQEIASGRLGAGSRLPSENALAARFGVNRHTVRRAMSHLARRGVVRIEQGRGTHAIEDAIDYVLGKRTRFSGNLAAAGLDASHRLLSTRSVAADKRLAGALKLRAGARITEVCATGEAGERVLSAGMHYFPGRLRGIAKSSTIPAPLRRHWGNWASLTTYVNTVSFPRGFRTGRQPHCLVNPRHVLSFAWST